MDIGERQTDKVQRYLVKKYHLEDMSPDQLINNHRLFQAYQHDYHTLMDEKCYCSECREARGGLWYNILLQLERFLRQRNIRS